MRTAKSREEGMKRFGKDRLVIIKGGRRSLPDEFLGSHFKRKKWTG
jgi:hypothetical protein